MGIGRGTTREPTNNGTTGASTRGRIAVLATSVTVAFGRIGAPVNSYAAPCDCTPR